MQLKPQNQEDVTSGWCSHCKQPGSVTEFWSAEIPTKTCPERSERDGFIICLELWTANCGNNLLCLSCAQKLLAEAMEYVLDEALMKIK